MRAYIHQGHGPRADQTGRIHISDFRYPRTNSLAIGSRSIHLGHKLTFVRRSNQIDDPSLCLHIRLDVALRRTQIRVAGKRLHIAERAAY